MSILDRLFGGNKIKRVTITEVGKTKLDSIAAGASGIRLRILDHIESDGASTVAELSSSLGYSPDKIKVAVKQMMREGWVQIINSNAEKD
jgi:predicted transcriptional regulator